MGTPRVIYGFHAVLSRLRQGVQGVEEIFVDAGRQDRRAQALNELAQGLGLRVHPVAAARLDGLTGHGRHQGVVALVSAPPQRDLDELLDELKEPALLLVLDGVQDPHNLGACLRVADAMGVHAVIAPKDRAAGINATVSKVASGATETVPYFAVTNLARTLRELKERSIWLIGADERGARDLFSARLAGPLAWVMGAEGEGMRRLTREHCDEWVRIPMLGTVASLNVAVASGICLFEARRQRAAAP